MFLWLLTLAYRSRGFGFITFSESHMVDECLNEKPHIIDDKQVDAKRAMPRVSVVSHMFIFSYHDINFNENHTQDSNMPELHLSTKKVFVGGVKDPLGEEELREHFSTFGVVENIDMVTDKETGKKRGFCFITFSDSDPVDKIVCECFFYNFSKCSNYLCINLNK